MMEPTKHRTIFFILLFIPGAVLAQQEDSLETRRLEELIIRGQKEINVERLPDISGTRIWSGKKNEVLNVTNLDANIAEKTARQVFAKVPGVFVYDMDGTGNQINIATRGLDPHGSFYECTGQELYRRIVMLALFRRMAYSI